MKVLIIGACGGLARHLIPELEKGGHELRLLDRVSPEEATIFAPKDGVERQPAPMKTAWPYLKAELLDFPALRSAAEGMDAIIHLAAILTGHPEQGPAIMQVNVTGTYHVLEAARLAGVPRVFVASSINAFGTMYWRISGKPVNYPSMPLTEDFPPVPEDPYSLSKWFNEETCAAFTRAYGMTTAAFRFAAVQGQRFVDEARANPKPTTAWSDDLFQWVHVADVATGLRQALECPTLPKHGVYSIGAADTRCPESTMELLEKFRPDLAQKITVPLPGRTALLSIAKAQVAFGYNPAHRRYLS
jgi:UDP-glucose 4-epimerase